MEKVNLYSPYGVPNLFGETDKKVKIIIDPDKRYFDNNLISDRKNYDLLFLIVGCEPKVLHNIEPEVLKYGNFFDRILSPYESVKEKYPKSEIFSFGSCWILTNEKNELIQRKKEYVNNFKIEDKKFKLSFIKSNKNFLPGHQFRHKISNLFNNKFNFDVLYPKNRIETKLELFKDSMFHLSIENCQQENYFTEKIIDCFMSYTIPIYWGCPNINKFFDLNGIIIVNNENELNNVLNNLKEEDYFNRLDSIKKNYQICFDKKYSFFFDRIIELFNL